LTLDNSFNSLIKDPQPRLDLLLGDRQRRYEPETAFSRSDDQETALSSGGEDVRCLGDMILRELEAQNETQPADLGDDFGILLLQRLKARDELRGPEFDGVLEFGRVQPLDDVMCDPAGERIPAECGTVIARLDVRCYLGAGDDGCTDGDAIPQGLGGGQDVRVRWLARLGREDRMTMSPEGSRAGESALDFVEDQDRSDGIASFAQRDEELGRRDVDSAFTLNRLHDDTARLIRDQCLQLLDVVELAVLEPRDHGREGSLILGVGCRRQGAHRAAMEGIVKGDEFVFGSRRVESASHLAGEFDGSFIRLCSRIRDKDLRCVAHRAGLNGRFHQKLAESARPGIVIQIRGMDQGF
jgi:hypothetical protein